jgi:hypothetical protein
MKDKQIAAASAEPRIPYVSAFLHCVSMTALVYLRSSFGFGFLRPRSVFFAFSWAFALYAVYAWVEGEVWRDHRAMILFGSGAVLLYWRHLLIAFKREWNQTGEHEHYSGNSHLVRLMQRGGQAPDARFEAKLRLWAEPGVALLVSLALRLFLGERALSFWLFLVAVCLWSKEALNHWFRIRERKRRQDMFTDTEEAVEPPVASHLSQEPLKAVRKPKVKRGRNATSTDDAARNRHFAEVLRLLPPFSLEQAEANYRELIKIEHPDANDDSEESVARAAELNEAIEYFRCQS